MEIISSIHHENAMPLAGFCLDDDGKFMLLLHGQRQPRGDPVVCEKAGKDRFGWPERFKVAAGVARALVYLHGGDGNDRPVIHRDVKSSNILISEDFQPRLCDFGLALWAAEAVSPVTSDDVQALSGVYLAPEYFMHGKVSNKIDVYAFGVVLLELVSGRKPVSSGDAMAGKESLVMWANSIIQGGKLNELVDASLPSTDDVTGDVERMNLAAALCIRRSPQHRPSIANAMANGDAVRLARFQAGLSTGDKTDDGDVGKLEKNDIQSYINLALLDVNATPTRRPSAAAAISRRRTCRWREYMKGKWSWSSSFD
uniref:Protein kinase domain-containing protein n=1 Tax=Leersia perrieri TaxID=77586 RepID=A0A0D9XYM1_9ORYZ